jgi:acetolactate synthase-1/2/3 large subunit
MQYLKELGYSHCFYVAGGNSMHLLESANKYFKCVPVIHEVTAAISAEYFNAANRNDSKAFALVTAGPGVTNSITGIAGAWLESRELLIVGGQVKSTNLNSSKTRQTGIQEINGRVLLKSICKKTITIKKPMATSKIHKYISKSWESRKGPVFIEICLDVSAQEVMPEKIYQSQFFFKNKVKPISDRKLKLLKKELSRSQSPVLLLGGGVNPTIVQELLDIFEFHQLPIACTWTGAGNCGFDYKYFAGRPNNFGMRWANIFLKECDLLISVGTSLGFQQTGFNTKEFLPKGKIVHVDIDRSELNKTNPCKRLKINMDSEKFLKRLSEILVQSNKRYSLWASYLELVRSLIPVVEKIQDCNAPYLSPHRVLNTVSRSINRNDNVVSCSSGGTFTAMLQCFENLNGQKFLSNKGLASMGYGLAGAIGSSFSQEEGLKTVLFEGDGGFAQNFQELGTVVRNKLNIKIFITNNNGYSSIKMSQKNYFNGNYIGCDEETGLMFPDWEKLCSSYGLRYFLLDHSTLKTTEFQQLLESNEPVFFEIYSDPDFKYLPRIESIILGNGQMTSKPLHEMFPPLEEELTNKLRFNGKGQTN